MRVVIDVLLVMKFDEILGKGNLRKLGRDVSAGKVEPSEVSTEKSVHNTHEGNIEL